MVHPVNSLWGDQRHAATSVGAGVLSCERRVLPNYAVTDASIFVAPWGNDRNTGALRSPLRSLAEASRRAGPGQLVMIRGGVYRSRQRIRRGGRKNKPVTYAAWPGEKPVFDGSGIPLPKNYGLLQISASNVIIDGIEIRNSSSRGFSVYRANDVTLRRSHIHHIQQQGYAGSGNDLVVEQTRFNDLVLSQSGNVRTPPHSAGVSTWYQHDAKPSRRFIFRDNSITRVWGECIIALHVTRANIFNNTIRECYSVGVYVDNSSHVSITRNLIAQRTDLFNRLDSDRRMTGISLAVEYYPRRSAAINSVTVANNLIIGTDRGVSFFAYRDTPDRANTYGDVLIAHNVLCDIQREAIEFDRAAVTPTKRNLFLNNVLCPDVGGGRRNVDIDDRDEWVVRHNVFSNRNDFERLRGNWLNPRPFIVGRGYRFRNYRLRANSPIRRQGVRLARVPLDAFCNQRNRNATSIGLHEL